MKNQNSENLSDWLTYYQILIEDVRFAKLQQWRLVYYILLLFGAIVGLSRIFYDQSGMKICLFITSVLLASAGTYFICKFQKDLRRYRKNIKIVRNNKFPNALRRLSTYKPAEKRWYYFDFVIFLIAVNWASVIFIGWAVGFWQIVCSIFYSYCL